MSDNQTDNIDYTYYSLEELKQAYASIDKDIYPERAEMLHSLIEERNAAYASPQVDDKQVIAKERVKFHGSGTEYFAIWIVNLFLSIVTLGIYSAWATVRTKRYFYSNTEIAGHRLSYLATPIQILVGRLIAFLLFVIFVLASNFSPIFAVPVFLFLFAVTPVIIVMGVRFRMRMMAYRNVRFNFTKRYGRAYVVFFLYSILAIITFYLALPWVLKKIDEFLYENMTYGDKKFTPTLQASEYYIASLVSGGIMFVGVMVFGAVLGLSGLAGGMIDSEGGTTLGASVAAFVGIIIYLFVLVLGTSFYQAYIRNHVYNNMRIEDVAVFSSDLQVLDLVLLNITNFFMLVFSLGLAYPWVKVRTTRLLTSATEISILEGINEVVAKSGGNESAVADEVIGAFDIDISIG